MPPLLVKVPRVSIAPLPPKPKLPLLRMTSEESRICSEAPSVNAAPPMVIVGEVKVVFGPLAPLAVTGPLVSRASVMIEPVTCRVPRPVLVKVPLLSVPARMASTAAAPLSTWIVRVAPAKSMPFWKVTVRSASAAPRIRLLAAGTKKGLPQVTVADSPPRLTFRSASYAAKPPLPVHCTCVAPVPRPRLKSPLPRPITPPLRVSALVPSPFPMPPGSAVALLSRSTPAATLVAPE